MPSGHRVKMIWQRHMVPRPECDHLCLTLFEKGGLFSGETPSSFDKKKRVSAYQTSEN